MTIIVSHGFSSSVAFMTPIISHILSTSHHRVVAVDQAAHGASSGNEASLGHFVRVLRRLVDIEHEAQKIVELLIGHSVGASALVMLFAKEQGLFQSQTIRPSLVLINPPLQPVTHMEVFCRQHSLPFSIIQGMRDAFRPTLEDVLGEKMANESWVKSLKVLLIQDEKDPIARPAETRELAAEMRMHGADLRFEQTAKLGHFKPASDKNILALISKYY